MQTKSPNKSVEQAFEIVQLIFVLQKLLKLNPPSKTIHQWLLDEIVSGGGCYLVGGERKPKDPIIRPSSFTIV